jgi:transposase
MKKLITTMMQRTLNKQDGRLTIGLDLGDRSSFYCVLDEAGDVLLKQKVRTTPKGDKRGFRSYASESYRIGDRNALTVGKPFA